MLAVRCALLAVLLVAPGTALTPDRCPAPGKGFARTRRAAAWRAGRAPWRRRLGRPEGGKEGETAPLFCGQLRSPQAPVRGPS